MTEDIALIEFINARPVGNVLREIAERRLRDLKWTMEASGIPLYYDREMHLADKIVSKCINLFEISIDELKTKNSRKFRVTECRMLAFAVIKKKTTMSQKSIAGLIGYGPSGYFKSSQTFKTRRLINDIRNIKLIERALMA